MKTLRTLKNLLLICAACAAAFATLGAATAAASTVAGTWSCCGSESGATAQSWAITESGGSLSGTASDESGTFSPISGKVSGASVEIVTGPYYGSSYSATFIGTISGETMSGTWTSNASQSGTWTAARVSGGEEAAKKAEEEKKKEEEEKAKALRKAAIQLNCDSFEPGLPTEYFQCTAQVADASGKSPAEVPTGTVSFAVNSGGAGAIFGTKTCTLAASQTGGASSFCSIQYVPPSGGLEIGVQPPITASYSGSSDFAKASTGPSDQLVAPLSPAEAFKSLCVAAFLPACEGVVPPPQVLQEACFSIAPSQGNGLAAQNICAALTASDGDVTITPGETSITTEATCPVAASDGLSSCELQAYVDSKTLDPDVKAELEYESNYAAYLKELAATKAAFAQQIKNFIASAPLEGNEQEIKEGQQHRAELTDKLIEELNRVSAFVGKRGTDNSGPYEAIDKETIEKGCEHAVNKDDCHTFYEALNESFKGFLAEAVSLKAKLGVDKIFQAPSKKAKGASISRVRHGATHPPRLLVYASGRASIPAGHKARIQLTIPAFVRVKLKEAFAKHDRTFKADLVVNIMTATGSSTTRTIPLKVKLVANASRHPARKK
jgi:hypothetical protein